MALPWLCKENNVYIQPLTSGVYNTAIGD